MPTKIFFCRETNKVVRVLRRYAVAFDANCSLARFGYHDASRVYDVVTHPAETLMQSLDAPEVGEGAEWPTHCECGYAFTDEDGRQVSAKRIMERTDTGEEFMKNSPPVGAVWNTWWEDDVCEQTADGRSLDVMTPGGVWSLDSTCKNCARLGKEHFCWVRHGRPEEGTLHVDKRGDTCSAGDGGITLRGYHGFLHNGILSDNLG